MNRRVLLIDADPAFTATLHEQLGRYRVDVTAEPDPDKAIAIASADPPALIIISVEEPDKAGFRVFQKSRKGPLAKVPVMLVTSSMSAESFSKHRGLKVHADDYLDKRGAALEVVVGKIDGLIELGDPLVDDELSIPIEDDISLDLGGAMIVDETVGEEHGEFASEGDTVGPADGIKVDSVVEAETDAAFAALLGDELGGTLADEGAIPEPVGAIPDPVPEPVHDSLMATSDEPDGPVPEPVHDGGAPEPEDDPVEEFESRSAIATRVPGASGSIRLESQPAIPIDDDEIMSLDDDLPVEVDEEPAAEAAQIHSRPPTTPPSPPPVRASEPVITSAQPVPPIAAPAEIAATELAAAEPAPRPGSHGSGSHPAIDLGLEAVAQDAESEQSGVYDRRALRKIGELERQIAQLKAELDRARTAAESGAKGPGREREFLNLRESILSKDKELRVAKEALADRDGAIAELRDQVSQLQGAKAGADSKHGELEQRLSETTSRHSALEAAQRAAAAQLAALQQQFEERTRVANDAETARAQLERDLSAERANRASSASEAERALRVEREQLIARHAADLAAIRGEQQAAREAALAALRDELAVAQADALIEAAASAKKAAKAEHDIALSKTERELTTQNVKLRNDLGSEVERLKGALAQAHAEHEEAVTAAGASHMAALDELEAKYQAELAEKERIHNDIRTAADQAQAAAIADLRGDLDRSAAANDVKLTSAKREYEQRAAELIETHRAELAAATDAHQQALSSATTSHRQEVATLTETHRQQLTTAGEAHRQDLAAAHAERDQLADEAERAAAGHTATLADAEARRESELAATREAADREASELRGQLAAAKRAADDAATRHQREHDAALAAHAQALEDAAAAHHAELAAKDAEHGGVTSALEAEHARAIAAKDAEHTRIVSAKDAEHAQATKALAAEHGKAVADITSERDELRRGLSTTRDGLKRAEGELSSAVQTIADRNADLRTHAAAIAERDQRIADLRKEIEGLEQENASYQEQVLRAYQKIKTDEAMVARARKAMAIALTVLDDQGNPTS